MSDQIGKMSHDEFLKWLGSDRPTEDLMPGAVAIAMYKQGLLSPTRAREVEARLAEIDRIVAEMKNKRGASPPDH